MGSRRKEHREDAIFRILYAINENPQMTTREIAQKVGISNGSTYYLLTSFIDKGFVRLSNVSQKKQKVRYAYFLTPKGIREKSLTSNKFLIRKKKEYKLLEKEINDLEQDLSSHTGG